MTALPSDALYRTPSRENVDSHHAFQVALGERVRTLRARQGLTRKALPNAARISERHLANLEPGHGNASVLLLQQLAGALQATIAGSK